MICLCFFVNFVSRGVKNIWICARTVRIIGFAEDTHARQISNKNIWIWGRAVRIVGYAEDTHARQISNKNIWICARLIRIFAAQASNSQAERELRPYSLVHSISHSNQ